MANYNSDLNLPLNVGTSEVLVDDRSITRSRSGAPKVRLLFTRSYREFDLQHMAISYAQKVALDSFYNAWRNQTFQFTYDSVTYNVIFGDPPPKYDPQGGNLYNVNVVLLEV